MLLPLALATLCLSCDEPAQPTGPRLGVPAPNIELGAEGCARFQVRFQQGNTPVIEETYNSSGCPAQELKLFSDTAATFDAATGALRIAIRVKNEGATTVVPRLRLRFHADSAQRFNASGQPLGGVSDILGYQPDSTSLAGRIAFWFYDTYMAPAGQPQVLPPGATTERRWIEFRGTTWSPHVRLKLVVAGQEVGAVPAVAPDSIPASLINALPTLTLSDGSQLKAELLAVLFYETASQSARQAAIASIGGVVVGGRRSFGTDGWYFVRVPTATTLPAIGAVTATLRNNPHVEFATEYTISVPDGSSWAKPQDGPGWNRSDWQVDALGAVGASSALGRLRAPLAWGCSTGSATVGVAVVDGGFHPVDDLVPNISGPILDPIPFRDHGTRVASIIGAEGNNGAFMTGVMWNAALHLRSSQYDTLAAAAPPAWWVSWTNNLIAAAQTGASVIVIVNNQQYAGVPPDTVNNTSHRLGMQRRDDALRTAIARLRRGNPSRRPLFVVSAGNDGIDARFAGFVNARHTYPEQVLVVGGLSHQLNAPSQTTAVYGGPLKPSNSGSAVDLYAPGENIPGLIPGNVIAFDAGTSYATPLAAGVAGLVKSFWSALPDTALKGIILAGASQTVATSAGPKPVLDAYGALKKAAERPGAPLCGNRLWLSGTSIKVQRAAQIETIPTQIQAADTVTQLDAHHGGRRIDFRSWSELRSVVWGNGSWSAGPTQTTLGLPQSGVGRSRRQHSHDVDSSFFVRDSPDGQDLTMWIELFEGPNLRRQSAPVVLPAIVDVLDGVDFAAAFPQRGSEALIAYNVYYANTNTPRLTALYRADLGQPSLPVTLVRVLQDTAVTDIAMSEDGNEKVLKLKAGQQGCIATWSRPTFGTSPGTTLFDSTAARRTENVAPSACEFWGSRISTNTGQGTVAPRASGRQTPVWSYRRDQHGRSPRR